MVLGIQERQYSQLAETADRSVKRRNSLVSGIIIFLNAEQFIQEAIESVFAQTYGSWELILVDDGSTDGSTNIALSYAERFSDKVYYVEHQNHLNRGMSASRNLGVRHAKGEYIAFLDADDVWLPDKLDNQVAILERYPEAAMVFGPWQSWYSWSKNPEKNDWIQNLHVQPNALVQPPRLVSLWIEKEDAIPGHCATLLRHNAFTEVGEFEEEFRDMYEDAVWLTKVCLHAPVFVEAEWRSRYRQHSDKSCEKALKAGEMASARLTFFRWIEKYLSKREEVKDREVWTVLQQALWPYRHPILQLFFRCARHPVKEMKRLLRWGATWSLSVPTRRWLRRQVNRFKCWQLAGWIRLGRLEPIRKNFGLGQGQSIDRYYIELFLARNANDIQGHVLEIQEDAYTRRFGGERVLHSDVLHVTQGNPRATIIADLTAADHIPSEQYDCIILTQTLQYIYDVRAAIRTGYRILKGGGVLLVTLPGIQQIDRSGKQSYGEYWRFTTRSAQRLFTEVFPEHCLAIQAYGNVLAATAFLHGLVREEMHQSPLDYHDKDYEMTITVRARRPREDGL